jgi:hypothetical protein
MNKTAIHICYTANDNYLPLAATSALSIIENTKEDVHFHFLTDKYGINKKRKVCSWVISIPKRPSFTPEFSYLNYCRISTGAFTWIATSLSPAFISAAYIFQQRTADYQLQNVA